MESTHEAIQKIVDFRTNEKSPFTEEEIQAAWDYLHTFSEYEAIEAEKEIVRQTRIWYEAKEEKEKAKEKVEEAIQTIIDYRINPKTEIKPEEMKVAWDYLYSLSDYECDEAVGIIHNKIKEWANGKGEEK